MAAKKMIIISHAKPLLRTIFSSSSSSSFSLLTSNPRRNHSYRFLSSSEPPNMKKKVNTKVNFSPSDSGSDSDSEKRTADPNPKPSPPPAPYDPFSKKPAVEEPRDPKDLQEIFHKMRTEGLFDSAVKMLDGLSRDGLTHEALELFARVKDRGEMPDVVAHTAVIEAYAGAGRARDALRAFRGMLASGVAPNAYTYSVLVKGLAADPAFVGHAAGYVAEMAEKKRIRPGVGAWAAAFEGLVRDGRDGEARELLGRLRAAGFEPDESGLREAFKGKRGPVVRGVMSILFDN